jgi:hypothetical protein
MRSYAPREMRTAVTLAVLLTTFTRSALFDPASDRPFRAGVLR